MFDAGAIRARLLLDSKGFTGKVKVGDFTDITESNNLKFKLNQLGYTEARVIKETVNIFEESNEYR